MIYSDNAVNILATKTYKGIGRAWINKNLQGNENVETIVSLLNAKSKQAEEVTIESFKLTKNEIIKEISAMGDSCDGLIAIGDKDFPNHRGIVKDSEKPIFLFYKGDLNLLQTKNNNITVIGLLNPDETIEQREKKIIQEITKYDITIISGLALGCDSIAHKEAIKNGKSIAILPSPLNNILPAKNKDLALDILKTGGLLISEYYKNFKHRNELNSRYIERDRLQALFCDTIILIASYAQDSANRWGMHNKKLDSGARLAMEDAKKYHIPRAVMYNQQTDQNNPMFDLNRELLKNDDDVLILTIKNLKSIINKIKNQYNINDVNGKLPGF